MVWFTCDGCLDTFKKPKLANHFRCGSTYTCVDCCVTFDGAGAKNHNQCVTEHEKYALGATKPGGFAANGVNREAAAAKPNEPGEPSGLEFLSTRPPWKCSVCNVNCTSKETLMSHASGAKHKRRARAALAAQNGGSKEQPAAQPPSEPTEPAATSKSQPETPQNEDRISPEGKGPAEKASKASSKRKVDSSSSSSSDSDSSSSSESESEAPAKKKPKVHPALQDADKVAKLIKAATKKISKKGKLGPKKIKALASKKLGVDKADDVLLAAIKEQLVAKGVGKAEGKFVVAAA